MRRSMWAVFAAVGLFASSASAQQAITPGVIVNLRSQGGQWLSATPTGVVYLSTNANPDAWEEWLYFVDQGRPALQSYHGTQLMVSQASMVRPGSGKLYAAASGTNQDTGLHWDGSFDATGKPSAFVSGSRVLFCEVLDTLYYLVEGRTTVAAEDRPLPLEITGANLLSRGYPAWTITVVASPKAGRAPTQRAVWNQDVVTVRNVDGTTLTPAGWKQPTNANHQVATQLVQVQGDTGVRDGPLRWGSKIRIQTTLDYPSRLESTPNGLIFKTGDAGAYELWTVVDPHGAPDGNVVPYNAPLCLKDPNGKLASAVPQIPQVQLSPNGCGAAWELWTIVPQK